MENDCNSVIRLVPVLALRDVVVFPHQVVPLFIGREKSVCALEKALESDNEILLVTQKKAETEEPTPEDLYNTGTTGTIIQFLKLPDSTVKVLIEGRSRVRIRNFISQDIQYANVSVIEAIPSELYSYTSVSELLSSIRRKLPREAVESLESITDIGRLVDSITGVIAHQLDIAGQQEILEQSDPKQRLFSLLRMIDKIPDGEYLAQYHNVITPLHELPVVRNSGFRKCMKYIELDPATATEQAIESSDSHPKIVLCGHSEEQEKLAEFLEADGREASEIVDASHRIDIESWLHNRKTERENLDDLKAVEGEWVGESINKNSLMHASEMSSGKFTGKIYGARIHTDSAWQIPAFFSFGGFNDCPEAEVHCAIWRYWENKYGAKIVSVTGDVLEGYISRPPVTKEDALELAWQQYFYCNDIVDQGLESISNLASTLMNSKYWFFWWD